MSKTRVILRRSGSGSGRSVPRARVRSAVPAPRLGRKVRPLGRGLPRWPPEASWSVVGCRCPCRARRRPWFRHTHTCDHTLEMYGLPDYFYPLLAVGVRQANYDTMQLANNQPNTATPPYSSLCFSHLFELFDLCFVFRQSNTVYVGVRLY